MWFNTANYEGTKYCGTDFTLYFYYIAASKDLRVYTGDCVQLIKILLKKI